MLARLEDAFRRLSQFSSDLAHELRTPVGTLMTQTQVAVSRTRSAEEYRETLYPISTNSIASPASSATCCFLPKPTTG